MVASAGMVLAQQPQLQISEDGILTSDYFQSIEDDRAIVYFSPGIQFDPVPSSIVLERTNTDFEYSVFVGDRSVAFTTDSDFDLTIDETGNTIPKYYESDPAILVDIPKCPVDDIATCYVLYTQYADPRIGIRAIQSGNYVLVSNDTPEPPVEETVDPPANPPPQTSTDPLTVTNITATGTENTTITQTITVTNIPSGYTYTSISADSALTNAGVSISGTESNGTITVDISLPSAQTITGNIVVSYGDGTNTVTSDSAVSLTVNPVSSNSCIPGLPDDGLRFGANVNSPGNLVQRYLDLDPDCTYVSSSIDAGLVNDGFVDDTDTLGSQLIAGFYHPTVLNGTTTFSGTYTVIFDKDGSTSEDIDISFTVVAPIIVALPEPVVVPPTDPETTTEGVSVDASSRLILVVSHTDENTSSQDAVATQYAVTVPPGYTLQDVDVDAGLGEAGVFASIVTEEGDEFGSGLNTDTEINIVTDSNGNPIIEFKSSPREFDRTARGTVLLDYVNTSTSEGVTYALPTTAHIIEGASDDILPNLVISASGGDAADPRLSTTIINAEGDNETVEGPNEDACTFVDGNSAVDRNGNVVGDLAPNCERAVPDILYLCTDGDIYTTREGGDFTGSPADNPVDPERIIDECDEVRLGDDTREGDYIARQPELVVIEGLADYDCITATRLAGLSNAHVQVEYKDKDAAGNHQIEFTAPYRTFPDVIEGVVKLNCSINNAAFTSFTLPVTINVNPTYDVLPFQGTLDPVSSGGGVPVTQPLP